MLIRLVSTAAVLLGLTAFTGIVSTIDVSHATTVAGCEEYTDSSNCDYDGEY
jgi:hypothetical protein